MNVDPCGNFGILVTLLITTIIGSLIGGGIETGKQIIKHGRNVNNWEWNEIGSRALLGAATGLSYGFGGGAGGMIKGTFVAIKGLTIAQSIGVLMGAKAITGFGQLGISSLSFITCGMMVGSGLWNVGKNAINAYSPISRGIAKAIVNYSLNNLFDGLRR